jgi:uncharacterized protein (DUF302 family)
MAQSFHDVETSLSAADAAKRVQEAVLKEKYGVIDVLNLKQTMAGKGVVYDDEAIVISVCEPNYAKKFLTLEPTVASCLPCRISVTTRKGKTTVSVPLPSAAFALFGNAALAKAAAETEPALKRIVEAAKA